MELKALSPLVYIHSSVKEISPLDFLELMDMPEDSPFFSSDNFRKLKKHIKREAKRAARELRKDNYFLFEVKEKDKALVEEERAERYGTAKAFLQEQEHTFKSGQLVKVGRRRR